MTEIKVRLTDLDEMKKWIAGVEEQITELRRERDEWEERYEELLAEVGGTRPS